jgi:hypothetical protein
MSQEVLCFSGDAVEGAELSAPRPGEHEGEQHELIALGQPGKVPFRPAGGIEKSSKLLAGQPVALMTRLRWRLEIAAWIREAVAAADPAQEPGKEHEAAVVGRRRGARALAVGARVIDDSRFLEDVAAVRSDQSSRSSIATR